MTTPPETSYKLDKPRGHEDFAAWKGDVGQILRSSDSQLLGLMPYPINNTPATQGNWRKAEEKAKTMIVLSLGPIAKVRCREFIFGRNVDERTAFKFWKFLQHEYTATNAKLSKTSAIISTT